MTDIADKSRPIAKEIAKTMQCNCDLDNWQPERDTGHSCVCRIHKATRARMIDAKREAMGKLRR